MPTDYSPPYKAPTPNVTCPHCRAKNYIPDKKQRCRGRLVRGKWRNCGRWLRKRQGRKAA